MPFGHDLNNSSLYTLHSSLSEFCFDLLRLLVDVVDDILIDEGIFDPLDLCIGKHGSLILAVLDLFAELGSVDQHDVAALITLVDKENRNIRAGIGKDV